MNEIRRIISLSLVFAILASVCIISTVWADHNVTDDYKKLMAIGILDDSATTSDTINRGDFAKVIVKMANIAVWEEAQPESLFLDVLPDNPNASYIYTLYQMGYLAKGQDGNFYPDKEITEAEAIKLLVSVLGYGTIAEQKGGYPTGYIVLAVETGILNGITLSSNATLKTAKAYAMIINTLQAPPTVISLAGKTITYTTGKNNTLLSLNFGIHSANGIVEANEYTDLLSVSSELGNDEISIDGVRYSVGNTNAADFLGINSEIYYTDERDINKRQIVYIGESKNKNNILNINSSDVQEANMQRIVYNLDNDKTKEISLLRNFTLIYNGKMTPASNEVLKEVNGVFTLIDNNNDGVYDIVKIMDYTAYIVEQTSSKTYNISTLQRKTITLDPFDEEYSFIIMEDNEEIAFGEIEVDDIISYAESTGAGKNLKTILVSRKKLEGTITSVADDSIEINGDFYNAVDEICKTSSPGEYAKFYFDIFDVIAYRQYAQSLVYGYLNSMQTESKLGTSTTLCRIFSQYGRWVTLSINSKVKYNGSPGLDASYVASQLGSTPGEYRQLIKYRVNSRAEIIEISTAQAYTPYSKEEKAAIEAGGFRITSVLDSTVYRTTARTFNAEAGLSEDTIIFTVPNQDEDTDELGFSIVKLSELPTQSAVYTGAIYDGNKVRIGSACVLYDPPIKSYSDQRFMIVDAICEAINGEGEVCPAINGSLGEENVTLIVEDIGLLQDTELQKGDIIKFLTNKKGEITSINRQYKSEDGWKQTFSTSPLYSVDTYVAGEIKSIDTDLGYLTIRYDESSYAVLGFYAGLQNVYIYEPGRGLYKTAEVSDLMSGDYILGNFRNYQAREIIIIHDN